MNENRKHAVSPGLAAVLALVVSFASAGCEVRYDDFSSFISEPRPTVSLSDYRLAPPDQITISSKRVREVNNHTETIRPDGKITLPLIGSLYVAGLTCEEASAIIEEKARSFYEDADASLRVVRFRSKKIYVFGEVSGPGPYVYDGANTVLETLSRAQPTRLADPSRIHVLRPGQNGEVVQRMTIDLDRMVKEGDTDLNAVLEEGDIIYVPPNPLAATGLVLQQLLLPIQPAANVVRGPGDIEDDTSGTRYGRPD